MSDSKKIILFCSALAVAAAVYFGYQWDRQRRWEENRRVAIIEYNKAHGMQPIDISPLGQSAEYNHDVADTPSLGAKTPPDSFK